MTDPYPVRPFGFPVRAEVTVPGSKSITNRALILAALADGTSRLENSLFSEDTEIMVEALKALGFAIETDPPRRTIVVRGLGGRIPSSKAEIHVGNSGTSARFLTAFCCLGNEGSTYVLDGVEQMRQRPIKDLVDALSQLGAQIETTGGFFPITIRSNGLRGGLASIDAMASSQFVSALLMVAPYAQSDLTIKLENPDLRRTYIDMTLEMLVQFGFAREGIEAGDDRYTISHGHGYAPKPRGYLVEGDASAASYFFGLPLVVTGAIEIHGITKDSLQGDTEFASQVEHCGATVDWKDRSALCSFTADEARPFKGSFYAFSDTFLTAAAITPVLDGSSRIEGIEHTRHQECDRVAAMADGLKRVGQEVTEEPASLTVDPRPLLPAEIETFHDHRVAMSFGVLGCRDAMQNGEPWLTLRNPGCCAKTFPTFFDALEKVRMQSEAASRD